MFDKITETHMAGFIIFCTWPFLLVATFVLAGMCAYLDEKMDAEIEAKWAHE